LGILKNIVLTLYPQGEKSIGYVGALNGFQPWVTSVAQHVNTKIGNNCEEKRLLG